LLKKIFIYAILLYGVLGFILLPLILKPQIIQLTQENTHTKVSIDSIYFNPFLFKFKISGLELTDLNAAPLVSLKGFYLDVDVYSLLYGAVHIHALELSGLDVALIRKKDKSVNLLCILKENNTTTKKETNSSFAVPRIIIDSIKVTDSSLFFEDNTLREPFHLRVKKIGLSLKDVDTAEKNNAKGKLRFYASLGDGGFIDLHSNLRNYAPLAIQGNLNFEANKLYTQWRYVKDMLNIEVADGQISLHTDYTFNSADINATKLENTTLAIKDLRLKPKLEAYDILNLKEFSLNNMTIKPFKRSVVVPNIIVDTLDVKVKRSKTKKIDWLEYVKVNIPKTEQKEQNSTKVETPFSFLIDRVFLKSSSVTLKDEALDKPAINSIDHISINLYNINSDANSWLKYDTKMQIDKKGLIATEGKIRQRPLRQEGTFRIKDISLKEITPYLQEQTYLAVEDGFFSAKAKTLYEKSSTQADLRMSGSCSLNSLFIYNTLEKSLLFSLNEITVQPFTLELMPNRLYVDTIDMNAFYVDAKIDKDKILNFSKLVKKSTSKKSEKKEKSNAVKKEPFPVKIAQLKVTDGSAKFQDFSIPLKFKTDIHDLNGVIYTISNNPKEITLINIDGEIDKYGSTKLKGRINTASPRTYTDIDFNFKNLALNSLSGYSANFAGYKIDSGKLFLDLGYDIVKSKLHGSNNVIIKNIELGDEVDDENVTVLPLGFVIALLEDDEGVIDIDMPVEGNLDKPDFKYGKVVWNTFTNLVTKAVTSPFKFLGSMLGIDSAALEYVEFEAGKSLISPMQREKLDKLAGIMQKRPKLHLSVIGAYDSLMDTEAIQTEKLIAEVLQKSGLKNKKEHQTVMNITTLEEVYKERTKNTKLKKLKSELAKKYTDADEYALMYRNKLILLCKSLMPVSKKELETLAKKRAHSIISYLSVEKKIALSRLQKSKIEDEVNEDKFVKVKFELGVSTK